MRSKEIIKSQYWASLEMLRQAILKCPDSLWQNPDYKNQFWHIAFHVIFYTHFYLHLTEEDFVPWKKHKQELVPLGSPHSGTDNDLAYSKADILAYLELCLEQLAGHLDALNLESESGFDWLPFNKLELQFYNIRHVQQHTGELCERLGVREDIDVGWVGLKPST